MHEKAKFTSVRNYLRVNFHCVKNITHTPRPPSNSVVPATHFFNPKILSFYLLIL